MRGDFPKGWPRCLLTLGRKNPSHSRVGQERGRDTRMSKKHVTHSGLEARTLCSDPLSSPYFLPIPHSGTKWHSHERQPYLWSLGWAGLPGMVPEPSAHPRAWAWSRSVCPGGREGRAREDRTQKCHGQGGAAGRDRRRILRGGQQSQASAGRESRASCQHPPLCLVLAFLVYQKELEGKGGVFWRILLLTPSPPEDRAPKQTDILFCAEKRT